MQFVRSSPLQRDLLKAAWPVLSVESKLQIIDALASQVGGTIPSDLADVALNDSSPIVRYWAARDYYFREPRIGPDGKELVAAGFAQTPPEELQRTARARADECALVRAATSAQRGRFDLAEQLIGLPQLGRLVKIRALDYPDTDGFASFVEEAVSKGAASVDDVRDCIWEYFSRDDIWSECQTLDADGPAEFSKQRGWERLWTIAAKAPIRIAAPIASRAVLAGKYWEIKPEQLTALPDEVKRVVVGRADAPAEKLRESINASPDKHRKELVEAVSTYYKYQAEGRRPSVEERAEYALDNMPNRQDAVFGAVKKLREEVEQLMEAVAAAPKLPDIHKATQQILNWVVGIGSGIGMLLYLMITWRHS
jgi:hypothetical protein